MDSRVSNIETDNLQCAAVSIFHKKNQTIMILGDLEFFIRTPAAWNAFLTWPTFSMTSFRQVRSLRQQEIVPRTVIDVGANIGQFAVACAKLFPGVTVHSFEPVPQCVAKLKHNMAQFPGSHVHAVALGERAGNISMNINSLSQASSILRIGKRHRDAFPDAREIDSIQVNLSTLDAELTGVSFQRPSLLKLDVQGYEPHVLEGASVALQKIDYVLFEMSFRPLYEGEKTFLEMMKLMRDLGFSFLRPAGWLSDPRNGEILQVDSLFKNQKTLA